MYLRDNKRQPVGCIVLALNASKTKIRYQMSVLNPADRFDRSMARVIAKGRLLECPLTITLDEPLDSMHEISERVMISIVDNFAGNFPARARKAAKRWLSINTNEAITYDDLAVKQALDLDHFL